jgi:hypothetical protein
MPPFDSGTRYDYYQELDLLTLEDSDSVCFNSSKEQRKIGDRDLQHFELRFEVFESYSPRIKALALRTLARDLVSVALIMPDTIVEEALSRVVVDEEHWVHAALTYLKYHPYFPVH